MRGSLESIFYDATEELRRADVPNLEGSKREARPIEEEASVLLKQQSASCSVDIKVI